MFGFLEKFRYHQPEAAIPPSPPVLEMKKPTWEEPELNNQELEKILETRPKAFESKLEPVVENINAVFLYGLQDDGRGIFKPQSGEKYEVAGLRGTLFKRERAAYLISNSLNLGVVPPTVIRAIDGRVGSFQHFVEKHKIGFDIAEEEEKQLRQEFIKLWIFDYIIWNFDRNCGNYLSKGGKLYAIDNGSSLAEEQAFSFGSRLTRGLIAGESLEPELVENFKKITDNSDGLQELRRTIAKLVGEAAANACVSRIKNITKVIAAEGCVPIDFNPRFSFEE